MVTFGDTPISGPSPSEEVLPHGGHSATLGLRAPIGGDPPVIRHQGFRDSVHLPESGSSGSSRRPRTYYGYIPLWLSGLWTPAAACREAGAGRRHRAGRQGPAHLLGCARAAICWA